MSESLKLCGVGIVLAFVCLLLQNHRKEFVPLTRVAGIIILFGIIITLINPIIDYFKSITSQVVPLEYIQIMLKALSIGFLSQISSGICKDCGENNIAKEIETVGKIEIILLSLPLITRIVSLSEEFFSW